MSPQRGRTFRPHFPQKEILKKLLLGGEGIMKTNPVSFIDELNSMPPLKLEGLVLKAEIILKNLLPGGEQTRKEPKK
jgi:hypothetical protein